MIVQMFYLKMNSVELCTDVHTASLKQNSMEKSNISWYKHTEDKRVVHKACFKRPSKQMMVNDVRDLCRWMLEWEEIVCVRES